MRLPSEAELLGAITSLGPSRECYKSFRKSRGWPAEAPSAPPAAPTMPAQRMRAALSAPTGGTAVLQRAVPEGGAGLVAVEGPGDVSGHGGGQTEAQAAEPALPGARQEPKSANRRSRCRCREGNLSEVFSMSVVTGLAATRSSRASGARHRNTSARTRAGVRWSASSGNASGTGKRHAPVARNPARGVVSKRWEWHRELTVTY